MNKLRTHIVIHESMNKLRTHIVIHESFLLYFIPKIVARLKEVEASCFIKNASASGFPKCQMLPSSLPLPGSFFKVLSLPLPQKFNRFHRFRFQLPASTYLVTNEVALYLAY